MAWVHGMAGRMWLGKAVVAGFLGCGLDNGLGFLAGAWMMGLDSIWVCSSTMGFGLFACLFSLLFAFYLFWSNSC